MKLALSAILTLAAAALAAPLASAQQIEYVQRPDRTDGYYPRVLRSGEQAPELLGKSQAKPNRYGNGKIVHVQPKSEASKSIRVFKAGKVSTLTPKRDRRPIKPVVIPRENRKAVVPVKPQKHKKGTVLVYKQNAFRAVPDQRKAD